MLDDPRLDVSAFGQADLRRVLDALPTRVWLLDADHRVVWANRNAETAFASLGIALRGANLVDFFCDDSGTADAPARQAALSGNASSWEGWSRYRDGTRRYTVRHFTPCADNAGHPLGYYEFTTDRTETMLAREEARRAADLLEDAIASIPDGVGIEGADGRLAECNAAYATYYGTTREALIGLSFAERIPLLMRRLVAVNGEVLPPHLPDAIERFAALRRATNLPVETTTVDGIDMLIHRANTREGGRVIIMTDVTQLRRREREAAEGRRLIEDAIEAVALGFAIFEPGGGLSLSNGRFADQFGTWATRPGIDLATLMREGHARGAILASADPIDAIPDRLTGALPGGQAAELVLADGRQVLIWRSPSRNGGFVLTVQDITEQRKAEEALRQSTEIVRDVLEACVTPLTMTRLQDGAIIYENAASKALFAVTADPDELRTTVSRWSDPENRRAFVGRLLREGAVYGWESPMRRDDGSKVWIALSARLIQHRGETVLISTAQDLTERRAQEAEIARQREIAHQSEKMAALGEVLAGVSHELNNPLSVLVGQATILRETAPDETVRRRAERLSQAAERCSRIVRSFLAMAREAPLRAEIVEIDSVTAAALDMAGPHLSRCGVSVQREKGGEDLLVAGDSDQLRQAIVNLLNNAADALSDSQQPRDITVYTGSTPDGSRALIRIADNGPGVPESIAGRIFEPLFTTKGPDRGSGLGLALCHRIALAHRGQIRHRPGDSGGAIFEIEIPLAGIESR